MACQRCIQAIQDAADVLHEMQTLDRDQLPPDTDWEQVRQTLVGLAGHLRRSVSRPVAST